jgi:hypothetical protein
MSQLVVTPAILFHDQNLILLCFLIYIVHFLSIEHKYHEHDHKKCYSGVLALGEDSRVDVSFINWQERHLAMIQEYIKCII